MKLIFLIENPKHVGGGNYSIFKFAEYLARRRHDIFIFAKNKNKFYDGYSLPKKMLIKYRGSVNRYFKGIEFLNRQYEKVYDKIVLDRFFKKNLDIDFVIGYLRDAAIKSVKYAKKYELKSANFVFEVPPWMEKDLGEKWNREYTGKFKRNWDNTKNAYLNSDVLISNSKLSQKECTKWISKKVDGFVYPGLDLDEVDKIKVKQSDNKIIYLGRLNPYKNVDVIIKALSKVKKAPILKIIGDGESRKKLENLCKELSVKCEFLGKVDDVVKFKEIKKSIYMVFPSSHEGFGMPPLEALYCGIPCLCSNKEIFNEVYGKHVKYFKENDVDDLVVQMNEMSRLTKKQIERNQSFIKRNFSWKKSAIKIEKMLVKKNGN